MIAMPSFVWQWNVLTASKSREMRINLMFLEFQAVMTCYDMIFGSHEN